MTTYCRDCDNVHSSTRTQPPFKWACIKYPTFNSSPYPDLDPDWRPDPPYALCRHVRHAYPESDCEEFSPRRQQTIDGINA